MKRMIFNIIAVFKIKRLIKRQLDFITERTDCVNLSVTLRIFRGYYIFNNTDPIAFFSFYDAERLLFLGKPFFNALIYSLCKKYSIEKY